MALAPRQLRKAKIDVTERNAERDVSDRESGSSERVGLFFQRIDRDLSLQAPRLHVLDRLLRRRPGRLATPHQQRVEHAIAEGLAAQRYESLGNILRVKFATARQHVEIL